MKTRTIHSLHVVDGDRRTAFCFTSEGKREALRTVDGGRASGDVRLSMPYVLAIPKSIEAKEMVLTFDKRGRRFTGANWIAMYIAMQMAKPDIEAIEARAGISLLVG